MEKETIGITILVGVLLVFILFVYIQSWRSFRNKEDNRFTENLYQYRKTLYFLFVISIGMLWVFKIILIHHWQTLVVLAGIVIFIDIFVFSTPTIKKIWRAEFQAYDPLKTYIQENSFIEEMQRDKLNYFSQLIQIAPLIRADIEMRQLTFAASLELFLSYYADNFGLRVHLYELNKLDTDFEPVDVFINTIQTIKQTHTLDWESMMDFETTTNDNNSIEIYIVEKLWNGEIVALDREEKHGKGMAHLCPIFAGEQRDILLFIEETHQRVYEMDALFITNLAFLFSFLESENLMDV